MSDDDIGKVGSAEAGTDQGGGLIDVGGLTFEEFSAALAAEDLGRALDYILASGQNENGYHGFNSRI